MRVEYKNHLWQVIGDVLVLVVNLLLVLGIIINLLDFVNPLLLFHFQLLGPTLNLLQNSFLQIVLLGQELDRNLLLFIIFFLTEIQCHRLFALLTNLNFNFGKWLWDCFHLGLQMTTLVKKGYVLNSSQNQPVYQFYQEVLLVFVQLWSFWIQFVDYYWHVTKLFWVFHPLYRATLFNNFIIVKRVRDKVSVVPQSCSQVWKVNS